VEKRVGCDQGLPKPYASLQDRSEDESVRSLMTYLPVNRKANAERNQEGGGAIKKKKKG